MSDTTRPIPPRPQNVNEIRRPAQPAQPVPGPAGAGEEPAVELPRVTFTLHALIEDFPFDVQFAGSADQLKATVARLRELGAVPPTARAAVAAEKAREAPRCEFHGPMKESTKAPGTWYCTKKMGDDSYCKSKA